MYISYHTIYHISKTFNTKTGTVQYSSTVTAHRQQVDLQVSGSLYPMPNYITECNCNMFTSLFFNVSALKFLKLCGTLIIHVCNNNNANKDNNVNELSRYT